VCEGGWVWGGHGPAAKFARLSFRDRGHVSVTIFMGDG